jgi:hypothetical protein
MLLTETLSGQVLTKEGVLAQLNVDQIGTVSPILEDLKNESASDPWAELGRWFLADPLTRTISPYSKVPVTDYIDNALKENTLESLRLAERAANDSVVFQQRIDSARNALESHNLPPKQ